MTHDGDEPRAARREGAGGHRTNRATFESASCVLELVEFSVEGSDFRTPSLSLALHPGEAIWVRGGIGSGKSLLAEALCGVRRPDVRPLGEVRFEADASGEKRRRGLPAFVPQDPRLAVLPTDTVAGLLAEAERRRSRTGDRGRVRELIEELARRLSLELPRLRPLDLRDLSGSERRRLLLLVAVLERSATIVLDGLLEELSDGEATLVLELLEELRSSGRAILAFSRAERPPTLVVAQEVVLAEPTEDWTLPLVPKEHGVGPGERPRSLPLLQLDRLRVHRERQGALSWLRREERATVLDGVSLELGEGEVLAVVGDSGSGKSTLLETLTGYRKATSGTLRFQGRALSGARSLGRLRGGAVQLVLGESEEVLEPRRTVLSALGGDETSARRTLERVGLPARLLPRARGELSPGELQLLSLGMRLLLEPELVLVDAPTFALDERALERFSALLVAEKGKGRSFLVTTNSFALARRLGDRTLVLHRGRSIELGPSERLFASPAHPMTRALGAGTTLGGGETSRGRGCALAPVCPRAARDCAEREPAFTLAPGGRALLEHHRVACFYPLAAPTPPDPALGEESERLALPPSTPPPPDAHER